MKKLVIAVSALALGLGGTAYAADQAWGGKPDRAGTMTRADAQSRASALFERFDANRDGRLDHGDRAALRAQAFDRMDTDRNGSISRQEFTARQERREARRGERGGEGRHMGARRGGRSGMSAMADANRDGVLTRAEFVAAALTRFDASDGNRDGQVTQAERQAHRAAMRQQRRAARAPGA